MGIKMTIKRKLRPILCLIITATIFLNGISTIVPVEGAETSDINEGDYFVYEVSSTATYRLYHADGRKLLLNVTNNQTFPMKGTLKTVREEDDQWVPLNRSNIVENVTMVPYIINTTNLAPGPENCSYFGLNSSRSYIIENWKEENLLFDQSGEAYADRAEDYLILSLSYSYQALSRDEEGYDDVVVGVNYTWDEEYGVLLKQAIWIDNLDDDSMDGNVNYTLIETSLWSLSTGGGIPGYPSLLLSMTMVCTISVMVYVIKKKNHSTDLKKQEVH